ncbi:hypothetical protein [Alicyclobacillus ferrooxydans]|uniref:Uncharacterized protein n=1 Tax=Alicyclobacillus ferrooxydans TaxID=471514 RepID=A0A0P9CVQ2_9BACL|nr:hypothetical protein [Alicyclobacillus ferrooxydans]KPV43809.1 hypothetical protein AN477_10545 [Alicyclobacillus ferrooxydans]
MNAYDKLVQQKRHGEKLDIKQLTYEILHHLWWDEDCSDGDIAKLFGVTKKKITNLRFKWGMKVPETIVSEFETRSDGCIPAVEENEKVSVLSKEATVLLRKLNGLNDVELESLRLALARRFPAFVEVKQETDFIQSVERVIRKFGNQK